MGLFKAIGRAFGRAVESVGDVLGSSTISGWGRSIQDKCSERIGSERSYKRAEANISTTDRLNEILVSFSDGYFKQATAIENACIRCVENFYDRLIEMIENASDVSYNRANLNALKRGRNRIGQSIRGGIKDPLAKRMSLDDSECLRILKMDSGAEKRHAMSAFSDKVINEALDNLSKKVRVSMDEQLEDIEDYLNNISEGQEKEFSLLRKKLDEMCSAGVAETQEREIHCIDSLILVDAIDVVCKIL